MCFVIYLENYEESYLVLVSTGNLPVIEGRALGDTIVGQCGWMQRLNE